MMNRKGKGGLQALVVTFLGLITVAVIAGVLIMAGVWKVGSSATKTKAIEDATHKTSDKADEDDLALHTCESSTSPDELIKAYDNYNPGTALTESTNLVRKKGSTTWSTFTAGSAITDLEVDAEYEVIMGITTTDFTDNAYGGHFFFTAPCKEKDSFDKPEFNDNVEQSLSSTFYNDNGDAQAQNFTTAGTTKEVQIKSVTSSDTTFGNPYISGFEDNNGDKVEATDVEGPTGHRKAYPNTGCMDLNSTSYDAPEKLTYKGVELKKVSQPTRHASASGKTTYCYEWPLITDSMDKVFIKLNGDDSVRPITDDTLSLYAANFYVDADDGKVKWGVENEEGAAVGTDAAATVVLDATA